MDIRGKKVFITGAAVRIGAVIARAFAAAGARVTLHSLRSEREAAALAEELGGAAAGHSVRRFDLTDVDGLQALEPDLSGASVLVNNASLYIRRTMLEETADEAERQFAVNFLAPVALMRLFARVCAPEAAVVNMLDCDISYPDSGSFSYALSKKALADATRAAALQLAPRVRVNALAPGPSLPPAAMPESKMVRTLPTLPLGRAVSPSDLADACLFLACCDSMTGAILNVDCGRSLRVR